MVTKFIDSYLISNLFFMINYKSSLNVRYTHACCYRQKSSIRLVYLDPRMGSDPSYYYIGDNTQTDF